MGGLQKVIAVLDMRNGHKGGVRVGFIYIKDMYNNDVGKGGAYDHEVYEAKKRVAAFRAPVCFISSGLIFYRHRYYTYLYY